MCPQYEHTDGSLINDLEFVVEQKYPKQDKERCLRDIHDETIIIVE